MTDFRALCAELLDEVPHESPLTCLARAALAQPTTRLYSYKVGEAEPIEDWGKGHTLVSPDAANAEAQPDD